MQTPENWLYPSSLEEAAELQRVMAARVLPEDGFGAIDHIGGADVSNNLYDPENRVYAAMVSLVFPGLQTAAESCAVARARLPYVPGFLAFREVPALVDAFSRLTVKPDVLLVDGHGVSHPRRLGIASHLGVVLDLPTIGVAKSILVGRPEREPGNEAGDTVPLVWRGRQIGIVLRTRRNVQPVYVSIGHKISLERALNVVLSASGRFRLPEPTRQAHASANRCRKQFMDQALSENPETPLPENPRQSGNIIEVSRSS